MPTDDELRAEGLYEEDLNASAPNPTESDRIAASAVLAATRASLADLLTAGDDYELAFTAPASNRQRLAALVAKSKVALTRIGKAVKGRGVEVLDRSGAPMPFPRAGYTHF
jgi:thiamine-monophosphate kinase